MRIFYAFGKENYDEYFRYLGYFHRSIQKTVIFFESFIKRVVLVFLKIILFYCSKYNYSLFLEQFKALLMFRKFKTAKKK